jgi:hypothetical protein
LNALAFPAGVDLLEVTRIIYLGVYYEAVPLAWGCFYLEITLVSKKCP